MSFHFNFLGFIIQFDLCSSLLSLNIFSSLSLLSVILPLFSLPHSVSIFVAIPNRSFLCSCHFASFFSLHLSLFDLFTLPFRCFLLLHLLFSLPLFLSFLFTPSPALYIQLISLVVSLFPSFLFSFLFPLFTSSLPP